ncbi:MAG: serine/threonine-protein kinase [Polyangiales bacterium]
MSAAAEPSEAQHEHEAVEDRFALVGSVLEGKYNVEKVIAEGGFGLVYKGVQSNLGRSVAIKVLKTPPELNAPAAAEFQRKFKEEATVIARHGHPNIVQVIDFGVSPMPSREVAPWMVLEWLPGRTLEQVMLERKTPYTPREALTLMRPVFEALAFVHEAGIAHRDLKPANIMIVESGRVKLPKLMDFGIAKLMDPNEQAGSGATRTRSSQNAFSPQYASPEQLSGTRTGPWTDVHALGLILSEMLTGQPAIQADDMTQLFVQILAERRPTPAKYSVDVGPWEPVLQRALAMKPDDRFKNAMDFLMALDETVPATVGGSAPEMTGQRPAVTASPTTLRQSAVAIPLVTQAPTEKKKSWLPAVAIIGVLALAGGGFAALKLRGATANTEPHSATTGVENNGGATVTDPRATQPETQRPAGNGAAQQNTAPSTAGNGTGHGAAGAQNTGTPTQTGAQTGAQHATGTTPNTGHTTTAQSNTAEPAGATDNAQLTPAQRRQQRIDRRNERRTNLGVRRPPRQQEVPVE